MAKNIKNFVDRYKDAQKFERFEQKIKTPKSKKPDRKRIGRKSFDE